MFRGAGLLDRSSRITEWIVRKTDLRLWHKVISLVEIVILKRALLRLHVRFKVSLVAKEKAKEKFSDCCPVLLVRIEGHPCGGAFLIL